MKEERVDDVSRLGWSAISEGGNVYVPPKRYLPGSNLKYRPDVAHVIRRRCQKGAK